MKYFFKIGAILAVSLMVAGCDVVDGILGVNIFSPFSKVNLTAAEIMDMGIDDLSALSDSPSFYDDLASDDTKRDAVVEVVDETLAPGSGASEGQKEEAAVLGANVWLETTAAAELVGNIVDNLQGLEGLDEAGMGEFIAGIVPQSALDDEAAFIEMIDALVAANAYYTQLGGMLDDANPEYADPDVNPGAVAQSALVAAMVAGIVPPAGYSIGEYLFALSNDPVNTAPPDAYNPPDTAAGSPLGNLLGAAGIELAL